jgi:hypothetical protein
MWLKAVHSAHQFAVNDLSCRLNPKNHHAWNTIHALLLDFGTDNNLVYRFEENTAKFLLRLIVYKTLTVRTRLTTIQADSRANFRIFR